MKLYILILFSLLVNTSFCQEQDNKAFLPELQIEELEKFYELEDYSSYYIDNSRSLSFENIKNKNFSNGKFPIDFQSTYWFKFMLKPIIDSEQLIFFAGISDVLKVYVPIKNSTNYQILNLGQPISGKYRV